MELTQTEHDGLRTGTKSDGKTYSVRDDRHRFFYPMEWRKFHNSLRKVNKPLFNFLINTGARIDEALHIRPKDFQFDKGRESVRIWKTKTKAKKKERIGATRTIPISSQLAKDMKKVCDGYDESEYIFPGTSQSNWALMKRILKKNEVKDWYNFSLHNIRKTHGMWLKTLGIDSGEICFRLGHDINTFIKHYGSPDIFSNNDIRHIENQIGDLYERKRRY